MKLKNCILLCLSSILMGTSCDSNDDNSSSSCDETVVISSTQYDNSESAIFDINSISIENNCLVISHSASGCDGESWVIRLIDSGAVMESMPAQRNVRFVFTNIEACLAYITVETSFDLEPLQIEGMSEVILNIANNNESIIYSY